LSKSVKIIQLYTSFSEVGGAQKVLLDLHKELSKIFNSRISSFDNWKRINGYYKEFIREDEFDRFTIKKILGTKGKVVFISHHRKITTLLMFFKFLLPTDCHIIHVAHNEFHTLRQLSIFPKNIIAVSEKVKRNLIEYFSMDKSNIKVIYNGIYDKRTYEDKKIARPNRSKIVMIYPARITHIKNQIDLIKHLKGRLIQEIQILFLGNGPDLKHLKALTNDEIQFQSLGFINDMSEYYQRCDFVLLFSKNEGLPISILEAMMYGKPVICNEVGGNAEIIRDGFNGYLANDYTELTSLLNSLTKIPYSDYEVLCRNARTVYEEQFCVGSMVENYTEYLNELLK
jgi:glycosyltransferase involved in cell wall biosynthesis